MPFAKKSLELIFSPLGIMTILLACGVLFSIGRRHRRGACHSLICGALLFLIFLFSPLAQYLMLDLEGRFPPMLKPPESPPVSRIVILSGYAEERPAFPVTSSVSHQTLSSLSEGLRLYRLVPGAKLILSGGVVKEGERSVAAAMADWMRQMGVRAEDVIAEETSQNTYENLFEVRKLVGTAPFILVAAACDLRRAVAVARKLQMNPMPAPAGIWALQNYPRNAKTMGKVSYFFSSFGFPSMQRLSRLQWAYHEYVGYVWYQALGRI